MKHDIVTIGSSDIDAFVKSKHFKVVKTGAFPTGFGECFSLGSKIELDHLLLSTGGGANNAATTFSRLGFDTGCCTRVGKDFFGDYIAADLKKRNITPYVIEDPHGHTAFSTILLMPSGERTILVFRGATKNFSSKEFLKYNFEA